MKICICTQKKFEFTDYIFILCIAIFLFILFLCLYYFYNFISSLRLLYTLPWVWNKTSDVRYREDRWHRNRNVIVNSRADLWEEKWDWLCRNMSGGWNKDQHGQSMLTAQGPIPCPHPQCRLLWSDSFLHSESQSNWWKCTSWAFPLPIWMLAEHLWLEGGPNWVIQGLSWQEQLEGSYTGCNARPAYGKQWQKVSPAAATVVLKTQQNRQGRDQTAKKPFLI
jgi:hypothetical protein